MVNGFKPSAPDSFQFSAGLVVRRTASLSQLEAAADRQNLMWGLPVLGKQAWQMME